MTKRTKFAYLFSIILTILLLIYTATTVVDKESVYLLSFNSRVTLLILLDVILGISVAKYFIEINKQL